MALQVRFTLTPNAIRCEVVQHGDLQSLVVGRNGDVYNACHLEMSRLLSGDYGVAT